jgi:hypothetical protein
MLQVTILEREQAARVTAAGQVKPPAVAFGAHVPRHSHKATCAAAAAAAVQSTATAAAPVRLTAQQQQQQQQQQQEVKKQKNFSVLERELENVRDCSAYVSVSHTVCVAKKQVMMFPVWGGNRSGSSECFLLLFARLCRQLPQQARGQGALYRQHCSGCNCNVRSSLSSTPTSLQRIAAAAAAALPQ